MHLTINTPVCQSLASCQETQPIRAGIYTIPPVVALGNLGQQNIQQLYQYDPQENLDTKKPLFHISDRSVSRPLDLYLHVSSTNYFRRFYEGPAHYCKS